MRPDEGPSRPFPGKSFDWDRVLRQNGWNDGLHLLFGVVAGTLPLLPLKGAVSQAFPLCFLGDVGFRRGGNLIGQPVLKRSFSIDQQLRDFPYLQTRDVRPRSYGEVVVRQCSTGRQQERNKGMLIFSGRVGANEPCCPKFPFAAEAITVVSIVNLVSPLPRRDCLEGGVGSQGAIAPVSRNVPRCMFTRVRDGQTNIETSEWRFQTAFLDELRADERSFRVFCPERHRRTGDQNQADYRSRSSHVSRPPTCQSISAPHRPPGPLYINQKNPKRPAIIAATRSSMGNTRRRQTASHSHARP